MDTFRTPHQDLMMRALLSSGIDYDQPMSGDAGTFIQDVQDKIDYAFQPIVDIHNGLIFGYEALLRGTEKTQAGSIFALFDRAFDLGVLHRLDIFLRAVAIEKFSRLPRNHKTKLFYNLDNRIIQSPDYTKGGTRLLLSGFDLPRSALCLEISERHEVAMTLAEKNLQRFRDEDYNTAIDDFGAGYSGLKLLLDYHPDFIKIDRSFIADIHQDTKKKLLVSTITDLAHVLGIFVVAEGVENEQELLICKEIGCDLVQGYYISRPSLDPDSFSIQYPVVNQQSRRQIKSDGEDATIINNEIQFLPPLRINDPMKVVFETFRTNKEMTFFPVVDEAGSPMGIVREHTLKDLTYSPFGKDLIANRGTGMTLRRFLSPCPVADAQMSAQTILETFSLSQSAEGIILVKDFAYLGFLSAASLLRIINDKNLALARDSNPLTKMPGNASIAVRVNEIVTTPEKSWTLVYIDLDNFKAFNDKYGFRQGDRAIMLLAQILQRRFNRESDFAGHVGGDDFFLAIANKTLQVVQDEVKATWDVFTHDVESFYDTQDRERGYLVGQDRRGNVCHFDLMTFSAALIHLPAGRDVATVDHERLDVVIAQYKKKAKESESHMATYRF